MSNKLKTHKGIKKRMRLTAKGKVRFKRSFAGHLLSGKSGKRRRRLRHPAILDESVARKMRPLLES